MATKAEQDAQKKNFDQAKDKADSGQVPGTDPSAAVLDGGKTKEARENIANSYLPPVEAVDQETAKDDSK